MAKRIDAKSKTGAKSKVPGITKKPGRPCSICVHKHSTDIDRVIVAQEPYRTISSRFNVSIAALKRHAKTHLPAELVKSQEIQKQLTRDKVSAELIESLVGVKKMLAACDEWLTDPKNPKKYYLGPRDEEIKVVYIEKDENGIEARKRASLHAVINAIYKQSKKKIVSWEYKHTDPRMLLLLATDRLKNINEMFLRMIGELKDMEINIITNPEWIDFRNELIQALMPFPEARTAVLEVFNRVA